VGDVTEPFDAIVVGSGMTGGFAAKELTERGLRTLLIERGRVHANAMGFSDIYSFTKAMAEHAVVELHGDIPLEPSSGKLIAKLITEQRLTCVLDVSEFDTRPVAGSATVIVAVIGALRSDAGIFVVRVVPFTYVVCRDCPFHRTTIPGTNTAPVTTNGKPGLPATMTVGATEEICIGHCASMTNEYDPLV